MGFIIWYKVQIEEADGAGGLLAAVASLIGGGLPVKVSNDLFSGQYILDANITLKMKEGANADEFTVSLPNLPANVAKTLKSKHADGVKKGKPLQAKIYLGYFENGPTFASPDPVMTGAITYLKSSVSDQGILETEIRGQELGGYHLRTYCISKGSPGPVNADELVGFIAQGAGVDKAEGSTLNKIWQDFTLTSPNGLLALEEIARWAESPLVVRDKKIYLGGAVGAEKGPDLSVDKNIVRLDQADFSEEIPEVCGSRKAGQVKSEPRSSLTLQILGEPKLRVGQTVKVDAPDVPAGSLRTAAVDHKFSTQTGYTCDVALMVADPGKLARRPYDGVKGVVDRIRDLSETVQTQRPAIDVGEVKDYEPGIQGKHLATLNYGQSPAPEAVAPSVETPVDDATQLHRKPIAAPFAWHKCGLIVPSYPKMRALLAHNRGLVNDAVVVGYLWSENPAYERPKNKPGDYWLCLPTELGPDGLPKGKATNDLTDKDGLRVIQAKGLRIMVGSGKLPEVGERPTLPDADTIMIEHASGTTITITSDGALKIETKNKSITLSNGTVNLKLGDTALEVS